MLTIINRDDVVIFDTFELDAKQYSSQDILEEFIDADLEHVEAIEFYSYEGIISLSAIYDDNFNIKYNTYIFQPNVELLNYMCKIKKLRQAVKRFYLKAKFDIINPEHYPLLSAALLGSN